MQILEYVSAHPWFTLIYLFIGGSIVGNTFIGTAAALKGGKIDD